MNLEQLITVLAVGLVNGAVSVFASVVVIKTRIEYIRETLRRHDDELLRLRGKA